MRCKFESRASDGLKVIEEIPHISPCMLEGRNGIGKTVAVQLLELVSGVFPDDFHTRTNLWRSLRERLGDTAVLIDQLRDGQTIYVRFSPEAWPEALPDAVGEWLGEVAINGTPATVGECTKLISVVRIAGDEDLEETLKRRIHTLATSIGAAERLVRTRGFSIEKELQEINVDLARADPDELIKDSEALAQLERAVSDAQADAHDANKRLSRLTRAIETKLALEAADQEAASLLNRSDVLVKEIKDLDKELSAREKEAAAADKILASRGGVEKHLAEAERLLRHRRARLANLEREVDTAAKLLSVSPNSTIVKREIAHCDSRLDELKSIHRQHDRVSVVRDLIVEISAPLNRVQADVGDAPLVRLGDTKLTVSQTLVGITTRGEELADEPQPAQLHELATQIEDVSARRLKLVSLLDKLSARDRAAELTEQADQEAREAAVLAAQASADARVLTEATRAVGAAQEALTNAHSELAVVRQKMGKAGLASSRDAEQDLASALAELGLSEAELTTAESTARSALAMADNRLSELNDSVTAMRRRLTVRQTEIDRLIERITSTEKFSWIFDSSPNTVAALKAHEERLAVFRSLRASLLGASERVYAAAAYLASLVGIAESFFSDRTDSGERRELEQELRPAFERVLGERLRETLNREPIRNALFDGSEVVSIDAARHQLTLRNSAGHETRRPMEAFSSGERAFAFTQARIADLEPPVKPNRLLVLDEFGAFVAADRIPDLAVFLADEVGRVADQVVVILPLHVNYQAEIEDTRGDLRRRYEDRLSQISKRGYCAVSLV